jgi:hypothetical protein
METYAPGGAGVYPEHTFSLGDERLVAVPIHDDPCAWTRGRVDQSMHKVQLHALQLHVYPQWQAELSELRVIVPRYGRHRRYAFECGEHSRGTDITSM